MAIGDGTALKGETESYTAALIGLFIEHTDQQISVSNHSLTSFHVKVTNRQITASANPSQTLPT